MKIAFSTPWKFTNAFIAVLSYPIVRIRFALSKISWKKGWRFFGLPCILKHRRSMMLFGDYLQLRSTNLSNPLGVNHPVIICTWQAGARLFIGNNFAMTGGSIVTAENIVIGNNVSVGANTTITDTDFHPLHPEERSLHPQAAVIAPVVIEDDVFIGMNSIILKGVHIGRGSVIGAGSVVTKDIPPGVIAAGNPARVVGPVANKDTNV